MKRTRKSGTPFERLAAAYLASELSEEAFQIYALAMEDMWPLSSARQVNEDSGNPKSSSSKTGPES